MRCFLVFLFRRPCFRPSKIDDDARTQRARLDGILSEASFGILWHLLCGVPVKTGGMEDQIGDSASERSVCTVRLKDPDGGRSEDRNGTLSCKRNVDIALCTVLQIHFM